MLLLKFVKLFRIVSEKVELNVLHDWLISRDRIAKISIILFIVVKIF